MSDGFRTAGTVRLRPGRESSLERRHPWVYSGALEAAPPQGVRPVVVEAADGRRLGVALPGSSGGSLALRVVAWGDEPWTQAVLRARLVQAAALRDRLAIDSDAFRLVHAEGDGLPGLVIDRYGDVAVVEPYEAAWEPLLATIADVLVRDLGCRAVVIRVPRERGRSTSVHSGELSEPLVEIREGRARFVVDLLGGQKTGFFLDQRDNRRRVGELAGGEQVLNLFAYSGGFAVAALVGGARRAVNVDASSAALDLARESYRRNGLAADEADFLVGDAFEHTRRMIAAGRLYGVVVVDPPAFVRRKADLESGLQGYRDVNTQALRLVRRGGLMLTCSCSALVGEEAFGGALLGAALEAGRTVRVLERRGAAPDHPVSVACPESRHLKAWLCHVS